MVHAKANKNKKMKELTLKLTLDQTNKVLEGLGQLPYMQVYEVIQTINMQANEQLNAEQAAAAAPAGKKAK